MYSLNVRVVSYLRIIIYDCAEPSLSALGPTERGPSLESIYGVSLTVDLCEG